MGENRFDMITLLVAGSGAADLGFRRLNRMSKFQKG